jgi:hypothetical protein
VLYRVLEWFGDTRLGRWLTNGDPTGWYWVELGAWTALAFAGFLVRQHDSLTHAVWSSVMWGLPVALAAFLYPKVKAAVVRHHRDTMVKK